MWPQFKHALDKKGLPSGGDKWLAVAMAPTTVKALFSNLIIYFIDITLICDLKIVSMLKIVNDFQ